MHPALAQTEHRPWSLPRGPWVFRQTWRDLLFLHWPIDADELRRHVPERLTIQEFDGAAWLGVIPFRMTGVSARWLPDVPGLSAFPELNVRTYVERDGKPGVWFLSLDAAKHLAVWAARRFFHLPYVYARMSCQSEGDAIRYRSERSDSGSKARFLARYEPVGPVRAATPGTLDHFLTERYCLYAQTPDGSFVRGEIHHAPWPLQEANFAIDANELPTVHGLEVDATRPAHVRFARLVDVVLWPLQAT